MSDIKVLVENAIAAEKNFSLGFMLVFEATDEEGDRVLHYVASDGLAYWQGLGYLYTAIEHLGMVLDGGDAANVDDDLPD